MATTSFFQINDVSLKGITAASQQGQTITGGTTTGSYGSPLTGTYPNYSSAAAALPAITAANPAASCKIVRIDVSDAGGYQECLQNP